MAVQVLTPDADDGHPSDPATPRESSDGCTTAAAAAAATEAVATLDLAGALDFRPTLPRLHLLACLAGSAAVAVVVAACCAVPGGGWGAALLCAVLVAASQGWLRERQYQALQCCERDLAGPASHFLSVDGVEYHYTQYGPPHATPAQQTAQPGGSSGGGSGLDSQAAPQAPLLVHAVHGLGASSFSWEGFVQSELAGALRHAVVTAHDMPGFGLTQRPPHSRHYSTAANAAAVRAIQDAVEAELAAARPRSGTAAAAAPAASGRREAIPAARRVLIGHSLGGAVVAEALIADPEGVAALVLVAPCVLAWRPAPAADPLQLPPSRSLGRALSLWARGLEPPPASGLLGAGARRALHREDSWSLQRSVHLHGLARLLVMAEGMPEEERGSEDACLVGAASVDAEAGSAAGGAKVATTGGEHSGHAAHWQTILHVEARGSPGLRRRVLAGVAEEAVREVDAERTLQAAAAGGASGSSSSGQEAQAAAAAAGRAAGISPAPGTDSAYQQAKQSRRQALARAAASLGQAALVAAARVALVAAAPLLVLALRWFVRSRRFWQDGLAAAVGSGAAISCRHVDGYRMAQLTRGWERGLLRFAEARLAEKPGLREAWHQARRLAGTPSQVERLAKVLARRRIPVLIVHGVAVLIVPPANSARLAAQLPGARLAAWQGVGHMPHEEQPQRFVQEVAAWLAEVLERRA